MNFYSFDLCENAYKMDKSNKKFVLEENGFIAIREAYTPLRDLTS